MYVGAVVEMMCVVCVSYKGGIVVMDVIWRRLCVNMIRGRVIYLFRVWQGCAQYFVVASCGQMHRDNRCMYMACCFYVCCSYCVGAVEMFVA